VQSKGFISEGRPWSSIWDGSGLHPGAESNATPREAWVVADAWGRRSWWRALAADASVVGPGGCGVVVMAGAGAKDGGSRWMRRGGDSAARGHGWRAKACMITSL